MRTAVPNPTVKKGGDRRPGTPRRRITVRRLPSGWMPPGPYAGAAMLQSAWRLALPVVPVALMGWAGSCAGQSSTPHASPPLAPVKQHANEHPASEERRRAHPTRGTSLDGGWGAVAAVGQGMKLRLPEVNAWKIDADQRWWTASHPSSESLLLLRSWRGPHMSTPTTCKRQACLWRRDIPEEPTESIVDRRQLRFPEGSRTLVTVSIRSDRGDGLAGHVTVFGADVGRCWAVIYTTHAQGPSAEAVVGGRLAVVAQHVVPTVTRVTIEDRARAARQKR